MRCLLTVIGLILISAVQPLAFAESLILPFGNIAWEDTYSSVAQKMAALPGIESCEVSFAGTKFDLIKKPQTKSITDLAGQWFSKMATAQIYKKHIDNRTRKEWKYLSGNGPSIQCFPVIIEGVPFTLTSSFVCNPGALIYKPDNVLFGPKGELLPFVLEHVSLTSKSPALQLKHADVSAVISRKFLGGEKFVSGITSKVDTTGTRLVISAGSTHYSIDYGGNQGSGYCQQLYKLYDDYEANLAVDTVKEKPNLSGGL